jgi:hypothetical protein
MPLTAQELQNAANALLDYNMRGPALAQSLQNRPLLDWLLNSQKTFPGGKENITWNVKGEYSTTVQGFAYDDEVEYANPANIKQAKAKWYPTHAGIAVTYHELMQSGISVTDTTTGKSTSNHSDKDMIVLTDLLQDKIDDMMEGWARSFNEMLWRDGTQDSKAVPGVASFVQATATASQTGTTFGIDRALNSWHRNRATIGIDTSTKSNLNLITTLQTEMRQLRRYGGRPDKFFAGSDFLSAFEGELRSKGNYTLEGWNSRKATDGGMADVSFKGLEIIYDPTLDDLGRAKYGYLFDSRRTQLMVMDGEDRKTHNPARPPEKYVLYRAMTWVGALISKQLNTCGLYTVTTA